MKHLKMFGVAALAAMALTAMVASSASATTLETNGVKNTTTVTIEASAEGSFKQEKTDGSFANTCTVSKVVGTTSNVTGAAVSGPLSTLTFEKCATEKIVTDAPGSLSIENIVGTTNGTVRSSGAKWTAPSPFGTLTCVTAEGVHIGTFTGKSTGFATIDVKAVLNCGFLAPSTIWEGAWNVTKGPNGITS